MPYVVLAPTILESERAKTVHALDHAATVTGHMSCSNYRKHKRRILKLMQFAVLHNYSVSLTEDLVTRRLNNYTLQQWFP
jgi:hypothetical protein